MLGSQITRALTITEKGLWSFLILAQMLALTNGKAAGGTNNRQIAEKRFTEMIKHNSGEMFTYLICRINTSTFCEHFERIKK